jgi:hypothetical protein
MPPKMNVGILLKDIPRDTVEHIVPTNAKPNDIPHQSASAHLHILLRGYMDDIVIKPTPHTLSINKTIIDASLCASIVISLMPQFETLNHNDSDIQLSRFFDKITTEAKRRIGLSRYATELVNWNKKQLLADLNERRMTDAVVSYVAAYLNINVIIIDHTNVTVHMTHEIFNPHKAILVIFKDNVYSPIWHKVHGQRLWSYEHDVIRQLLAQPVRIFGKAINEIVKIGHDNDLNVIMSDLFTAPRVDDDLTADKLASVFHNDTSRKQTHIPDETEGLTDTCAPQATPKVEPNYQSMTCIQLKELAKERGIKLTHADNGKTKTKTKAELIADLTTH